MFGVYVLMFDGSHDITFNSRGQCLYFGPILSSLMGLWKELFGASVTEYAKVASGCFSFWMIAIAYMTHVSQLESGLYGISSFVITTGGVFVFIQCCHFRQCLMEC